MNSIESVLNMIATEAVESAPFNPRNSKLEVAPLTTIRFDLELIEREDGKLEWVE